MIKPRFLFLVFGTIISLVLSFNIPISKAYDPNVLIDDDVFSVNSMSASQIDSWLNTYFPNSCISTNSGFDARLPIGYSPSGGFTYGGFASAGSVIATAAQVYGINPQVLLVTLQKEQSLVQGGVNFCNNGDENKYSAAVGYGCPDGGSVYNWSGVSLYRRNGVERTSTGPTCVNSASKAGFSQQVIRAAWLLKFGQQRSLGNTNWAVVSGAWDNSDDLTTCYGGPMTKGTLSRCKGSSATFYDGYTVIDGTATYMGSGATAALYWYTPHFHGNQNFVNLFESWFGSTISDGYYACKNSQNIAGTITGEKIITIKQNNVDNLSLVLPNNTGSSCIEVHSWLNGSNYQRWVLHRATNSPAINPVNSKIIGADLNGDGYDELYKIDYFGTASGMIEVHGWDSKFQRWTLHAATNRPCINPQDAEVIAADFDGDGRDSLYLVQYRNTGSGRLEIHGWSNNFQQWVSHVATVSPVINHVDINNNPVQDIIAEDVNGDGRDSFLKIDYAGTQSGKVEVHGLTGNLQQWSSHIATNQPSF